MGDATPTYGMLSLDVAVRELKSSWVPLAAAASHSGVRPHCGVSGFACFLCWAVGGGGALGSSHCLRCCSSCFPSREERKLVGQLEMSQGPDPVSISCRHR